MSIIRIADRKKNPYFMMSRAAAQDERLSFEARGMLAYLLSKPDHWEVNVIDLQKHAGIGKHKCSRITNELVEHGYFERIYQRDPETGKMIGSGYIVYEQPKNREAENLSVGKPGDIDSTDSTETTEKKEPTPKPPPTTNKEPERAVGEKRKIIQQHEELFGEPGPTRYHELLETESKYPEKWVDRAVAIARENKPKSWAYVEAILKRWEAQGPDGLQTEEKQTQFDYWLSRIEQEREERERQS